MEFPVTRLRRLRRTETMRSLVRETHLRPDAFIYPLFICPGEGVRREVSSMPGVFNLSIDEAMKEVEEATRLGLAGVLLFGIPAIKDEQGSGAWDENGIVQQGLRALKGTAAAKKNQNRMCARWPMVDCRMTVWSRSLRTIAGEFGRSRSGGLPTSKMTGLSR